MGNHTFNVVVILFWLTTMSWLFVAKILPPLRLGEPPSYAAVLQQSEGQPPGCWSIQLNDRVVGWAATKIDRRADGISDLYNRVYLGELPFDELVPTWMGALLKPVLGSSGPVDFDKKSHLVIDPLGHPVDFESRLRVAELTDAVRLVGQIEGGQLRLSVQSGDLSYKMEPHLPGNAMMLDELSPQSLMPGLHVGQSWTVPVYSPLRPPHNPIEVLQATVEREDQITWEDAPVLARVIVYRADAGSAVGAGEARGRVWVREDGLVICQEVSVLQSRLRFVRLGAERAKGIWSALPDDWMGPLTAEHAKRLLSPLSAAAEAALLDPSAAEAAQIEPAADAASIGKADTASP